jgi:hypothetical protein
VQRLPPFPRCSPSDVVLYCRRAMRSLCNAKLIQAHSRCVCTAQWLQAQQCKETASSTAVPAPGSCHCVVEDAPGSIAAFCGLQVLRKAFPGVLLVPDVCGLQRLPKVRATALQHSWP